MALDQSALARHVFAEVFPLYDENAAFLPGDLDARGLDADRIRNALIVASRFFASALKDNSSVERAPRRTPNVEEAISFLLNAEDALMRPRLVRLTCRLLELLAW